MRALNGFWRLKVAKDKPNDEESGGNATGDIESIKGKSEMVSISRDDLAFLVNAVKELKADKEKRDTEQVALTLEQIKQAEKDSPPAPIATGNDELVPGSYVKVGAFPNGEPMFKKVRFSLAWFEKNFPMVEFEPSITHTIGINGVRIAFEAEKTVLAPQPFVDEYRAWRSAQRIVLPRALSADEDRKIAIAALSDGVGYSRLHFAGWGAPEPSKTPEPSNDQ